MKSTLEIGSPPKHPFDIDVIIDDIFLENFKKPEHQVLFQKVIKMVDTMENLNDEE
jgi:hypothetical protein